MRGGRAIRLAGAGALLLASAIGAAAMAPPKCRMAPLVLWGDGRHDDTAALNAWWAGERVIWAGTGQPVGPTIAGHTFRLSAAIYVPSGTGRRMIRFRLVWPQRHERLSGGTIAAGNDPDRPPVAVGIAKIGGDSGEGVPFAAPGPSKGARRAPRTCLIS